MTLVVAFRNKNVDGVERPDGTADYEVAVFMNKDIIAEGVVENHRRADGWRELLRQAAAECADWAEKGGDRGEA